MRCKQYLLFFHQLVFLVNDGQILDCYHGICYWLAEVDEKYIPAARQCSGLKAAIVSIIHRGWRNDGVHDNMNSSAGERRKSRLCPETSGVSPWGP